MEFKEQNIMIMGKSLGCAMATYVAKDLKSI